MIVNHSKNLKYNHKTNKKVKINKLEFPMRKVIII